MPRTTATPIPVRPPQKTCALRRVAPDADLHDARKLPRRDDDVCTLALVAIIRLISLYTFAASFFLLALEMKFAAPLLHLIQKLHNVSDEMLFTTSLGRAPEYGRCRSNASLRSDAAASNTAPPSLRAARDRERSARVDMWRAAEREAQERLPRARRATTELDSARSDWTRNNRTPSRLIRARRRPRASLHSPGECTPSLAAMPPPTQLCALATEVARLGSPWGCAVGE